MKFRSCFLKLKLNEFALNKNLSYHTHTHTFFLIFFSGCHRVDSNTNKYVIITKRYVFAFFYINNKIKLNFNKATWVLEKLVLGCRKKPVCCSMWTKLLDLAIIFTINPNSRIVILTFRIFEFVRFFESVWIKINLFRFLWLHSKSYFLRNVQS